MNLDELQSVQARERQSSDLQHLRSSFYKEVGEFINRLTEKRARVVEAADDPFSEPEVRRLTDDIETAEGTVEAIYERRVGKVVKKASIAAAGMPVEEDGLTSEEDALFTDLVDRIEQNRESVLSVLDGDSMTVSCTIDENSATDTTESISASTPAHPSDEQPSLDQPSGGDASVPDPNAPGSDRGGVSAADLMGDASESDSVAGKSSTTSPDTASPPTSATDDLSIGAVPPEAPPASDEPSPPPSELSDNTDRTDVPGLPRTTVRITADIGEIVGADDRDYDLGSEDVVTLPEPNADVLIEKNAAERL